MPTLGECDAQFESIGALTMKGIQAADEEIIKSLERIADKYPEKTSLIYLGMKFSFSELKDLIHRFANALYELGVRKNDKVMLYLTNCPQWLIGYYAIQKIGGVVVPTSPIYTSHEIEYQLNDSGAKIVICQDTHFGYASKVLPDTNLEKIIVTNIADMLPWW